MIKRIITAIIGGAVFIGLMLAGGAHPDRLTPLQARRIHVDARAWFVGSVYHTQGY